MVKRIISAIVLCLLSLCISYSAAEDFARFPESPNIDPNVAPGYKGEAGQPYDNFGKMKVADPRYHEPGGQGENVYQMPANPEEILEPSDVQFNQLSSANSKGELQDAYPVFDSNDRGQNDESPVYQYQEQQTKGGYPNAMQYPPPDLDANSDSELTNEIPESEDHSNDELSISLNEPEQYFTNKAPENEDGEISTEPSFDDNDSPGSPEDQVDGQMDPGNIHEIGENSELLSDNTIAPYADLQDENAILMSDSDEEGPTNSTYENSDEEGPTNSTYENSDEEEPTNSTYEDSDQEEPLQGEGEEQVTVGYHGLNDDKEENYPTATEASDIPNTGVDANVTKNEELSLNEHRDEQKENMFETFSSDSHDNDVNVTSGYGERAYLPVLTTSDEGENDNLADPTRDDVDGKEVEEESWTPSPPEETTVAVEEEGEQFSNEHDSDKGRETHTASPGHEEVTDAYTENDEAFTEGEPVNNEHDDNDEQWETDSHTESPDHEERTGVYSENDETFTGGPEPNKVYGDDENEGPTESILEEHYDGEITPQPYDDRIVTVEETDDVEGTSETPGEYTQPYEDENEVEQTWASETLLEDITPNVYTEEDLEYEREEEAAFENPFGADSSDLDEIIFDKEETEPYRRPILPMVLLLLIIIIMLVFCTRLPSYCYSTVMTFRNCDRDNFFVSRKWGQQGYAALPMGDKSV